MRREHQLKMITIWGGWYGSRNVGDQALLITIAELLRKTIGEMKLVVLTDNPQHVKDYMRRETMCEVEALHNRREFLRVVRLLAHSDLFIFGGGVPFYENLDHVLAMALLVGIARTFKTPYMLWAVSSQEVHSPFARRVFRWVLEGAIGVTYRDEHTANLFRSCGFRGTMEQVHDPGFWLAPVSDAEAREIIGRARGVRYPDRPLVALTPRHLAGGEAKSGRHFKPKKEEQYDREVDCFATVLDWCWENGFQPIFVPMHVVSPDDDRLAASRIVDRARNGVHALSIQEEVEPRQTPAVYQQCAFSFVARVHGSISSAIGGCPVGMYAFAPKYVGIMRAMGLEEYCIHEESVSLQTIHEVLQRLHLNRQLIRNKFAEQIEFFKESALKPALLARQILLNREL